MIKYLFIIQLMSTLALSAHAATMNDVIDALKPFDRDAAIPVLELVDGEDKAEAQFYLALTQGGNNNFTGYRTLMKQSADAGYWLAQVVLSQSYYNGFGVAKDDRMASYWYKLASPNIDFNGIDRKLRGAFLSIGNYEKFFDEHQFLNNTIETSHAFHLPSESIVFDYDNFNYKAMFDTISERQKKTFGETVIRTENGNRIIADLPTSEFWDLYARAIDEKDAQAAYKLGNMTFWDSNVSLRWLLLASTYGHAEATFEAGSNILLGRDGDNSNPDLALQYYKLAAEQGSERGATNYPKLVDQIAKTKELNHIKEIEQAEQAAAIIGVATLLFGGLAAANSGGNDFSSPPLDHSLNYGEAILLLEPNLW